jgi:hypothetical protein
MLIVELKRQIPADVTLSIKSNATGNGFLLFICKIKWLPKGSHFILEY